jgi:hypothetical protein
MNTNAKNSKIDVVTILMFHDSAKLLVTYEISMRELTIQYGRTYYTCFIKKDPTTRNVQLFHMFDMSSKWLLKFGSNKLTTTSQNFKPFGLCPLPIQRGSHQIITQPLKLS